MNTSACSPDHERRVYPRVCSLPVCPNVRVSDQFGLLFMDHEEVLTRRPEVFQSRNPDTFGVEFRSISPSEELAVGGIIARLYR